MTNGHSRTSPFLLLLTVVMCLLCGLLFTGSSAIPSVVKKNGTDTFAKKDPADTSADKTNKKETEITLTPSPVPKSPSSAFPVSPEASHGVWVPVENSWMFMVNGSPYTGWLTDTDGKRYFLTKAGTMKTGWLELKNKKYYFDLDGIMQTGSVVIEQQVYHFLEDGSLKGYVPQTENSNTSTKTPADTNTPVTSDNQTASKYVALTFDDGPSSFTDRLLDCLTKYNAKATFFFVGEEVEHFPETAKRIVDLGFETGNHTYSHEDLTSLTAEEIQYQISATEQAIFSATGQNSTLLRPPYGSINNSVSSIIDKPAILWSVDTLDWESRDPQKITEIVLNEVENGSIILMHDIFSTSVDAVEMMIPELINQGYQFVTIHELAEIQGIHLQSGNIYGSFDS